ncbi:hypothetical protein ScPMuIL_006309 [Solemya velum]
MGATKRCMLLIGVISICFGLPNNNASNGIVNTTHGGNLIKDFLAESDLLTNRNKHNEVTENDTGTEEKEEGVSPKHTKVADDNEGRENHTDTKLIPLSKKGQASTHKIAEDNKSGDDEIESDAYDNILQTERIRKVLTKYISPIFAAKPIGFLMAGRKVKDRLSGMGISDQCMADTITLFHDFVARKPYAAKMFDANANIPAGVLDGRWFWPGNYEECKTAVLDVSNITEHQVLPQYCLVQIQFTDKIAQEIKQSQGMFYGNCQPASCTELDVHQIVQASFTALGARSLWTKCEKPKEYSNAAIGGLTVCGFIILLALLGTICDVSLTCKEAREKDIKECIESDQADVMDTGLDSREQVSKMFTILPTKNGMVISKGTASSPRRRHKLDSMKDVLLCFSVVQNWRKLLAIGKGERHLSALGGIRVLSLAWIVLGHMFDFSQIYMDNILRAQSIRERFEFQLIGNASFSVDTFFFMSGLLVTYISLKQLKSTKGHTNWVMFYIHRFLRLTPAFAFVLMFTATLRYLILRGPRGFPEFQDRDNLPCQNNWWAVLFYFGNFFNWFDRTNTNPVCMGWDWYLDVDMQLYIFSPILIFLLYKKRNMGLTLAGMLIIVCVTIRAVLVDHYGLHDMRGFATENRGELYPHDSVLYDKPYARMATYITGMILGYIFYATDFKVRVPKVVAAVGWGVALLIALSVVYGTYGYVHSHTTMSHLVSIAYISLGRIAWSVAVGWVVFACATGHGGPVNNFLSWRIWIVLGRLSYCMYLVHPLVITTYLINQNSIHFTDFSFVYMYAGFVLITMVCALVLSLAVEAPMLSLEKILFKAQPKKKQQKPESSDNCG